jgi:hypothetical protein
VVATVLIDSGGVRLLLGQGCGGGDRILHLHQRSTTLDRCSNSSSVALHI